jgi:hypothetical protein
MTVKSQISNLEIQREPLYVPPMVEIKIPTPLIKIDIWKVDTQYPTMSAYYLPFSGNSVEDFTNYNPKYFLFVAKKNLRHKKRVNGINTTVINPSGFYHPTHQNGVNFVGKSFYSGITEIPLDTEFTLNAGAYVKTPIAFNPIQWVRKDDNGIWVLPTVSDFGLNLNLFKFSKKGGDRARVMNFKLAIGIENPNKNSKQPIIFSELSETFRISYKTRKVAGQPFNGYYGIDINMQTTGLRKKI